MKRNYFLKTDRIGFSKWEKDDMELARMLWGDPKVTNFICSSGRFSEEDIESRLNKEVDHNTIFQIQYWPIFEIDSNQFIGCCGLRSYKEGKCELGFHLCPQFWRRGYATEAARVVIDYAFSVLNVEALFAGHHPHNTASSKVLIKLGFQYIGDEFYEPTGLNHPSYELNKENKC